MLLKNAKENYEIMKAKGYNMNRKYYRDKYNTRKTWEVTKMKGAYYLRQYINGRQYGRGLRTTKRFIHEIGIDNFPEEKMDKRN